MLLTPLSLFGAGAKTPPTDLERITVKPPVEDFEYPLWWSIDGGMQGGFDGGMGGGGGSIPTETGKRRDPALQEVGGALLEYHGAKAGRIISDWTTIRGGFKGLRNVMRGKATLQGAYDAAKAGKEMVDSQSSGTDPCDCR